MAVVALVGTLDTKGAEYTWLAERLVELGTQCLLVDAGSFSTSDLADVTSDEVIAAAGADADGLRERRNRGEMMQVMRTGVARVIRDLAAAGRIHGLLALGGSGGSSVAAGAIQALPVGFPKLLVSTMASGDVGPYVGEADATLVFGNAAAAIAGMAKAHEARLAAAPEPHRPLVGITMFGVTTPAADEARERLTELGYEVLVFHATGTGGRALEKLVESGALAGVCDLTTTELADDLVGGVLSAGPERLERAGRAGLPQVVSLGALDMVNFGPAETVPPQFADRTLFVHNPSVTLMRTTRQEMAELGRRIAAKLATATGPAELFIPLRGVSAIDVDGGSFRDAEADAALFEALRSGLAGSGVVVHELDQAINDPGFGAAMAQALHTAITTSPAIPHTAGMHDHSE